VECPERGGERSLEVGKIVSSILSQEKMRHMEQLEQGEVLEGWPMDTTVTFDDYCGEDVQPKFFQAVCSQQKSRILISRIEKVLT
jgi:hypothetical protein